MRSRIGHGADGGDACCLPIGRIQAATADHLILEIDADAAGLDRLGAALAGTGTLESTDGGSLVAATINLPVVIRAASGEFFAVGNLAPQPSTTIQSPAPWRRHLQCEVSIHDALWLLQS